MLSRYNVKHVFQLMGMLLELQAVDHKLGDKLKCDLDDNLSLKVEDQVWTIHSYGNMNDCTKFHGNSSNSCRDI